VFRLKQTNYWLQIADVNRHIQKCIQPCIRKLTTFFVVSDLYLSLLAVYLPPMYRVAQKVSHYQMIKNRIQACQWD